MKKMTDEEITTTFKVGIMPLPTFPNCPKCLKSKDRKGCEDYKRIKRLFFKWREKK